MRQGISVLFALPLALLLAAGAGWAQTPPAPTAGGPAGPGARSDYTAEFKIQGYGGPTQRGRVYGAPGKERREVADIWGGTTLILRYDLGLVWTLQAARPFYSEFPLSPSSGSPALTQPGEVPPGLVFVENDDINDMPARKYRFPAPSGSVGGEIWLTEDNIALRIDSRTWPGAPEIRFELDHLVRAPQNPALFEIPAGYRKVPGPPPPEMAQPAQ